MKESQKAEQPGQPVVNHETLVKYLQDTIVHDTHSILDVQLF